MQYQWSHPNPIDFKSEGGETLANYRQTVAEDVERKGIVFFVHDYGCSTKNHAFLAQMFASHGFEFCGLDQLGFGMSEGNRG